VKHGMAHEWWLPPYPRVSSAPPIMLRAGYRAAHDRGLRVTTLSVHVETGAKYHQGSRDRCSTTGDGVCSFHVPTDMSPRSASRVFAPQADKAIRHASGRVTVSYDTATIRLFTPFERTQQAQRTCVALGKRNKSQQKSERSRSPAKPSSCQPLSDEGRPGRK
jgi:hypothetical protein